MDSKKNILITGGTRGIGYEISKKLNAENAIITVTGTSKVRPKNIKEEFKYEYLDLSCERSVESFISNHEDNDSCYDVVVNNAGINKIDELKDINFEDFQKVLNVNLFNTARITLSLSKKMQANRIINGRIVNIASIWSEITKEGRVSYSTSKSGLIGFSRSLATDLAKSGILVNSISPGFIDTDLTRSSLTEDEISRLEEQIPLKRLGNASEIAELVLFLTGPKNTYITGQNIFIDGGFKNV